jgi:D-alanine-D-alanine ligase
VELRIGLTYNLRREPAASGLPEDHYIEFDEKTTVTAVADALKREGHEVIAIEDDENIRHNLQSTQLEMVFNIAEGEGNGSREARIPAMLESLRIPYTGSGPLALSVALDKAMTNDLLNLHGVNTPLHQVFYSSQDWLSPEMTFPLMVKPLHEGSSKGIKDYSLVHNHEELARQVSWVIARYRQPAIVEEYIGGREFTIALLGNNPPNVLPIVEIDFGKLPATANKIYSYEAKWVWDTPENPIEMFVCPARIGRDLCNRLSETAREVFNVLGCRDICRIDIRLDGQGRLQVLDVNPLPGLIPDPSAHSCLPEAARAAGYTYEALINAILRYALERYGLGQVLQSTHGAMT